jgi:hypothetical protein
MCEKIRDIDLVFSFKSTLSLNSGLTILAGCVFRYYAIIIARKGLNAVMQYYVLNIVIRRRRCCQNSN